MSLTTEQITEIAIAVEEMVVDFNKPAKIKTTFDDRVRIQEDIWDKEDKRRQDKIILILKIQDVFNLENKIPYETLEILEDEYLNELLKEYKKTNDDCDKQIVKEIIDNSILMN